MHLPLTQAKKLFVTWEMENNFVQGNLKLELYNVPNQLPS